MSTNDDTDGPSVVLCGIPPKEPHSTELSDDGIHCPKCGSESVYQGYGLAGGGVGLYEGCDADGCDWFAKQLDEPEVKP